MPPTETMEKRCTEIFEKQIPKLDNEDLGQKRQFAAEYSQSAYKTMIDDEYPIGNYTGQKYAKMHITSK